MWPFIDVSKLGHSGEHSHGRSTANEPPPTFLVVLLKSLVKFSRVDTAASRSCA